MCLERSAGQVEQREKSNRPLALLGEEGEQLETLLSRGAGGRAAARQNLDNALVEVAHHTAQRAQLLAARHPARQRTSLEPDMLWRKAQRKSISARQHRLAKDLGHPPRFLFGRGALGRLVTQYVKAQRRER